METSDSTLQVVSATANDIHNSQQNRHPGGGRNSGRGHPRSERGSHRGHRDQYRGGGGGGDQDRERPRERDQDRERPRERDQDRERPRERDQDRERPRERDQDRERPRERDQDRERPRERDQDRERPRERDQDRERPRDRDQNRDRDRDRERGRGRGYGRGGGGFRGRGPRGQQEDAPKSNTLVIKDADNEFLRMLKQANEVPSKNSDGDPMGENRRKVGHANKARQFQSLQASRVSKPQPESEKQHKACPVCLMDSPSLTGELVQAITSCEHIYCFECALRLIFITDKADCPICRQTLTKIVLTRTETLEESPELKSFLSTSNDPAVAQNTTSRQFKNYAKMVYYDSTEGSNIFELIKRLIWFNCPFCPAHNEYSYKMTTKNQASFEAISRHLGRKHDRNLCDLCFFNLELFPYEYDFYSNYEMDQHKRFGSTVSDAQVTHRMCHLCAEPGYYFNNEALATHCKEAHICCYVCNSQTIFFIDQPSLVDHVVDQHICCPECQRTNGQVIGFLSVIELKSHAHVEHPAAKIDYEALTKAHMSNARELSAYGQYDVSETTNGDSTMSRREAFDVIDNLLRNRFSAERHLNAPSFNPKTESYLMAFPGLEGMGVAQGPSSTKPSKAKANGTSTNLNLFPASKYRQMTGKISNDDYEEEFPGLGPGAKEAAKKASGQTSIAAAAASMKFKPQNWQSTAVPSAASQFLKTPTDLTNKKAAEISKKLKPRKTSNSMDPEEAQPSIYDDMIFTNPLDAPQTIGMTKPSSIQLIDARPSALPSAPAPYRNKGPPPIEAFPALGRPAPVTTPGGVNWSKAMASNPIPKAKPKKQSQASAEPKEPSIDLNDGGSFPGLADGGGRPGWLGAPSGKWSGQGGGRGGKKKGKSAKAVDDNEWYRPNGEPSNEDEDSSSQDPYITHIATADRNNQLRGKVRQQLIARAKGRDSDASEAFNAFKELSLSYRNGDATADSFFELGRDLLGADFFDTVVCDLISLLPNITKQNELYERAVSDPRLKSSRSAVLWRCSECAQLVIPAEKAEHQRYHTKSNRR